MKRMREVGLPCINSMRRCGASVEALRKANRVVMLREPDGTLQWSHDSNMKSTCTKSSFLAQSIF